MKKAFRTVAAALLISALTSVTAMAASVGWVDNGDGRWWYCTSANGGSWFRGATGSVDWEWIDGNNDGISECYCFDDGGWLFMNTITPDGYTVNASGQWVVNGAVQTKSAYIYSAYQY